LTSKLSQHQAHATLAKFNNKGQFKSLRIPPKGTPKKKQKNTKKIFKTRKQNSKKKTFKTIRAFSSILKSQKSHFGSLEAST
jgi:hypothetical protein